MDLQIHCTLVSKDNPKPWQDDCCKELPLEMIKVVSQNWSQEIWESYLRSLETPERAEYCTSQDIFTNEEALATWLPNEDNGSDLELPSNLSDNLKAALTELSPNEYRVTTLTYWEGMTLKQVARKMEISKGSAQIYKRRAIQKLEKFLSCRKKMNLQKIS